MFLDIISVFNKRLIDVDKILSSANKTNLKQFDEYVISFINTRKRRGPNILPSGTPYSILRSDEFELLI